MKLYSHPLSGHAHRARLFLSLIGVDAEIVSGVARVFDPLHNFFRQLN